MLIRLTIIHYIGLLLCLLFATVLPTSAQRYGYKHFSSIDGLPSSEIYEVIQDKKGFIWFCTDHGISRFDGYSFKNFPTGMADNTIFKMVEDDAGVFWCETFTKALYLFDGKRFSPYRYNDSILAILKKHPQEDVKPNVIRSFFAIENSHVIISFSNGEIVKLSATSFERISTFAKTTWNNIMPNNTPYLMLYQNHIVTNVPDSTPKNAYFEHKLLNIRASNIGKRLKTYSNIGESANGFVFLTTVDSLYIVDRHGKITTVQKLKPNFVHAKVVNATTFAIGYASGCEIYRYLQGEWKLTYELLKEHFISNFCYDTQGNMWITSVDDGVFLLPNVDISFVPLASNEVINYKVITIKAIEENIWLSTEKKELYKIPSNRTKAPYLYKKEQGTAAISDVILWKGNILTNGELEKKYHLPGPKYMISIGDTIWVGGVFGLDKMVNGKKDPNFDNTQLKERITAMCYTKKGLLVGLLSGLYWIQKDKFIPVSIDSLHRNVRIASITEDNDGTIWVATRGAGIMILRNHGEWIYITQKQGLPTDFVEGITIEKAGKAWIATYSGLVKLTYSYQKNAIKTQMERFTNNEGLPVNEVSKTIVVGDELWIATSKGLGIVKSDSLYNKSISLPLVVEAVNINGQNQLIQNHYDLEPNQTHFAVSLIGLFLKDGKQLKYIYELTGEVSHIDTSESQLLQFYNLHAGSYKLTMYAYHPQKNLKSAPQVITFKVNPHFTNTIGFYLLLLTLILGTMVGIFYMIYRNQHIQNLTRLEVVQWEQKALRAQMNPHFIFNILNSIQSYMWENDRENAIRFLGKFALLIRKTLQHSRYSSISLAKELEALKLYIDLEIFRIGKDLTYSIKIGADIPIEQTLIPPIIFQPLVENAIWHGITKSPRAGEILISLQKEGNTLIGVVADNGVGLSTEKPENVLHESIGLKNIEARLNYFAKQHNGNISISLKNKADSEGTIFIFRIPFVTLPATDLS